MEFSFPVAFSRVAEIIIRMCTYLSCYIRALLENEKNREQYEHRSCESATNWVPLGVHDEKNGHETGLPLN